MAGGKEGREEKEGRAGSRSYQVVGQQSGLKGTVPP